MKTMTNRKPKHKDRGTAVDAAPPRTSISMPYHIGYDRRVEVPTYHLRAWARRALGRGEDRG